MLTEAWPRSLKCGLIGTRQLAGLFNRSTRLTFSRPDGPRAIDPLAPSRYSSARSRPQRLAHLNLLFCRATSQPEHVADQAIARADRIHDDASDLGTHNGGRLRSGGVHAAHKSDTAPRHERQGASSLARVTRLPQREIRRKRRITRSSVAGGHDGRTSREVATNAATAASRRGVEVAYRAVAVCTRACSRKAPPLEPGRARPATPWWDRNHPGGRSLKKA